MGFQNTVVVEVLMEHRFDGQLHLQTDREIPTQYQKKKGFLVLPFPIKKEFTSSNKELYGHGPRHMIFDPYLAQMVIFSMIF